MILKDTTKYIETRKVLFEKTQPKIFVDFRDERWKNTNISSVISKIEGLNDLIRHGHLFGELGDSHEELINLHNASHIITDLKLSKCGNMIFGDFKFLNTPQGNMAKELYNNGLVRLSMRGTGFVHPSNSMQSLLHMGEVWDSIITWDFIIKNNNI
jgi:hypothetical protein